MKILISFALEDIDTAEKALWDVPMYMALLTLKILLLNRAIPIMAMHTAK
jgi:hypothetical protein